MLSFDFPRTDRFSQIVSRWKILWSFTTAWASSTLWNQCSTDIDENMWLHMVWRKGKISLRLDCMSQESRWTYICGIEDFRVRGDMNNNNEPFFFRKKRRMKLRWGRATFGTWVAHSIMGSICYENISIQGVGLSNRGLATLAGNSMHVASAARLSMMCCVCVCLCVFFILRFDFECLLSIPTCCLVGSNYDQKTQVASALLAAIFACELKAGGFSKSYLSDTWTKDK